MKLLLLCFVLLSFNLVLAQSTAIPCAPGYQQDSTSSSPSCIPIVCFGIPATLSSVCSGHGTCVAPDTCSCKGIFHGANCSIQCDPGWVALDTSNCAPLCFSSLNGCGPNGDCYAPDKCSCKLGYSGRKCDIQAPACRPVADISIPVCSGNGLCIENTYCTCKANWAGTLCEIQVKNWQNVCNAENTPQ